MLIKSLRSARGAAESVDRSEAGERHPGHDSSGDHAGSDANDGVLTGRSL